MSVYVEKNCNQGNPHLLRQRSLPYPSFPRRLRGTPTSTARANQECALRNHTPNDVMHARARAAGGGGVQAGKEGAEQSGAAEGETDSPSSRRKPWWRRVAFVRMLWTKQRDFTDELTSTNVDPRRSSASGTTVLRRYFVIYFIFPPLV